MVKLESTKELRDYVDLRQIVLKGSDAGGSQMLSDSMSRVIALVPSSAEFTILTKDKDSNGYAVTQRSVHPVTIALVGTHRDDALKQALHDKQVAESNAFELQLKLKVAEKQEESLRADIAKWTKAAEDEARHRGQNAHDLKGITDAYNKMRSQLDRLKRHFGEKALAEALGEEKS